MPVRLYHIVVDAHDPGLLARFWAAALDQQILYESDDQAIVGSDEYAYPGLCFLRVPDDKVVKNRLHLDLNPVDRDLNPLDRDAEVERVIALGAYRADVGQGDDVDWVVLADPEGNEFCVLRPLRSLID